MRQKIIDIDFTRTEFEIEKDLYLYEYGYEDFKNRESYDRLHRISLHVFQFVARGEGTYTLNGITYPLKPFHFFYLPPKEPLLYQHDTANPYMYYWIGLNGKKMDELLLLTGLSKKTPVIEISNPDKMLSLFEDLFRSTQLGTIKIKACIYSILDILCENRDANKKNTALNPRKLTENIVEFIKINFPQSDLRITDISNYFHLEQMQLYRMFNAAYGVSAKQFLMDYRLQKAYSLLSEGISVTHTAFQTGFSDIYYFSKQFKKKYGFAPSQIKKRQRD